MWSFFPTLFMSYTIGFALLAFLPRWRWLLSAMASALVLCTWAFYDMSHADGPGVMVALPVAGMVALGFIAGFVARAAILTARSCGHPIPTALVLSASFAL